MRKSHSRQCGDADVSDFLAAYSTECVGRGLGHFLSLGNLGYRLPSITRTRACWGMAFPRHPKTRITTAMYLYAKKKPLPRSVTNEELQYRNSLRFLSQTRQLEFAFVKPSPGTFSSDAVFLPQTSTHVCHNHCAAQEGAVR